MKKFLLNLLIALGAVMSSATSFADEGLTADVGLQLRGWGALDEFGPVSLSSTALVQARHLIDAPGAWHLGVGLRADFAGHARIEALLGAQLDASDQIARSSPVGKELLLLDFVLKVGPDTDLPLTSRRSPDWLWAWAELRLIGPGSESMAAMLLVEADYVPSAKWIRIGLESETDFVHGPDTWGLGMHVRAIAGSWAWFELAYQRMLELPERDQGSNSFMFRFRTNFGPE